jgi:CubicO group peptidase (beta-lactamase class C family)
MLHHTKILYLASLMACLSSPSVDAGPVAPELRNPSQVDAVIDGYVEQQAYAFVYARLEDRDGGVIYEHAAVNEGLVDGLPINGDTWIRIWSMSKIVTIAVVMDLVEDGVLDLSDRVVDYIPEFADLEVAVAANGEDLSQLSDPEVACPLQIVPAKYAMTVQDLVNHRGGFYYPVTRIDCLDEPLRDAALPAAHDSESLIKRLAALPLINQPGTTYYYGTGTTVLGLVAERATGKSLAQLVEERATGPLGITGLQYGLPRGARLSPRYTGKSGVVQKVVDDDLRIFGDQLPEYDPEHELYLGGEGMLATADGYADFARMLLRRGELNGYRFLEESTVAEMIAPHTVLDNENGHNGYNFWITRGEAAKDGSGPGSLWIGGGYEGTHFWVDPERGFVGVVMAQIFDAPKQAWGRDEAIRTAIYEQIGGAN